VAGRRRHDLDRRFFREPVETLPERFEAGTPNFADAVALGAACDYLDSLGRPAIAEHDGQLAALAYQKLTTLPGIRLLGPTGARSGLVSFSFADVHAHDLVTFADEDGVALRGGHHCNQPLMRKLGLTGTTRASFYVYNTEAEIDALVASLRRTLSFFGAQTAAARHRRNVCAELAKLMRSPAARCLA
jgi:cysteine desulfurase/selenocysteine lyase